MWHPIQVDSTGKRVIISGTGPPITEKRSIDEGRICLRLLRRQRDFTRRLGRLGYQNPAMGARRRVRLCALPRLRKGNIDRGARGRSEEHTSELQSLMRISYAVFCLKKKNKKNNTIYEITYIG